MRISYTSIVLLTLFTSCNSFNDRSGTVTAIDSSKVLPNQEIPKNRLLVPGKSIGEISIHQKIEAVYQILGKADSSDAAMGKAFAFWKSNDKSVLTVYSETNMNGVNEYPKVKQIRITSDHYRSADGIQVGSSLNEIKKQYPDVSKTAVYFRIKDQPVYIYDSIDSGISFDMEAERSIAITIHEPGVKSTVTYLALHRGIKLLN